MMFKGRRHLIAGCGYVGSELGKRLARKGESVWGIRRSSRPPEDGIDYLAMDLNDPSSLQLPEHVDFAYYMVSSDERSEEGYRRAYLDGFRNFVRSLEQTSPQLERLIYCSSTGVYGQQEGEWVDEESPTSSETLSGKLLLEGEKAARAVPFPSLIVRFGGIYGPGRNRLLQKIKKGQASCSEHTVYTNRIHLFDCARSLIHLAHLKDPLSCYIAVDDEPTRRCELLRWLARQLSAPEPQKVNRVDKSSRTYRSNKRCDNGRLRKSGFEFEFPNFREGYRQILESTSQG